MRALVVADVHSNLEALQAVLEHAGDFDVIWSLGDVVGYGPDPGTCVDLLRSHPLVAIAGNHDLAAVGAIGLDDFNPFAAEAVRWTAGVLTADKRRWLAGLPEIAYEDEFTLVHGSLTDPVWDYLLSPADAREHLGLQTTPYCLVGHTHAPAIFYERASDTLVDGESVPLVDRRFVANPGGVGQPRDGDPRAAYAVVDTEARRIDFHRVEYEIAATQAKIRAAGLPAYLADRLARGR